jgi:hypothetical protein
MDIKTQMPHRCNTMLPYNTRLNFTSACSVVHLLKNLVIMNISERGCHRALRISNLFSFNQMEKVYYHSSYNWRAASAFLHIIALVSHALNASQSPPSLTKHRHKTLSTAHLPNRLRTPKILYNSQYTWWLGHSSRFP